MDNKLFDELLTSVQEAEKIMRGGELEPSRKLMTPFFQFFIQLIQHANNFIDRGLKS